MLFTCIDKIDEGDCHRYEYDLHLRFKDDMDIIV